MNLDKTDNTLLLNQLRNGKEQAFSKVYDYYSRAIYRHVLRLVSDEDIAAEILQEIFLAVWIKRENIDPTQSFWPYLYKVAKLLIYSHYRKVSKDKRLLEHLIITSIETVTNAEELLIDRETQALLIKAIEHLPPQRKQVFKLCKFEGKSYQEAADILGISTSTISNQIVAANKSVKEFFLLNTDLAILFISCTITFLAIQNSISPL